MINNDLGVEYYYDDYGNITAVDMETGKETAIRDPDMRKWVIANVPLKKYPLQELKLPEENGFALLKDRLDFTDFTTYLAYTDKDFRLCDRLDLPFIGCALTDDGYEVQVFVSVERWEAIKKAAVAEYKKEQESEKCELEEVADLLLGEYIEEHKVSTAGARGSW